MDRRAENRGRPHQKVRFSAAPVKGRNFLTPGYPSVRVRNVRGKSGTEEFMFMLFFLPRELADSVPTQNFKNKHVEKMQCKVVDQKAADVWKDFQVFSQTVLETATFRRK